jgi:hypothetical protein
MAGPPGWTRLGESDRVPEWRHDIVTRLSTRLDERTKNIRDG